MLKFFSSLSMRLNTFNFFETLQGIESSYTFHLVNEQVDAYRRGGSPQKGTLRFLQWLQINSAILNLITIFTTLGWLRTVFAISLIPFGLPFLFIYWPTTTPSFLSRAVTFLDQHTNLISLVLFISGYVGLFLIGQHALALAALSTLAINLLDHHNYLPLFIHNTIKKYLEPVILVLTVAVGKLSERLVAVSTLISEYTRILQPFLIHTFKFLGVNKAFVAALQEQQRIIKPFDFRCQANRFKLSLQQLNTREYGITHAHVRDQSALLPPNCNEELTELITLFDSIKNWRSHAKTIAHYRKTDWHENANENTPAYEAFSDAEKLQQNITLMRNNLVTFIQRLKNNELRSVKVGADDILKRYTRAIIHDLKQLPADSQDLIDQLIYLGFETGEYCPIGLLKAVQNAYLRHRIGNGTETALKHQIHLILQSHRETFFQNVYLREKLHDMYWESFFLFAPNHNTTLFGKKITRLWSNHPSDLHAYATAIAIWAPRLGIPALAYEYSDMHNSPATSFWEEIYSALSDVEQTFWQDLTIPQLKQQIKNAVNTPSLPIASVKEWYEQFIDTHVTGTKRQKAALKRNLPYTIEFYGDVPIYRLKEEIINLMLLDFGIIYLKKDAKFTENTFRTQRVSKRKPKVPSSPAAQTPLVIFSAPTPGNYTQHTKGANSPEPFQARNKSVRKKL